MTGPRAVNELGGPVIPGQYRVKNDDSVPNPKILCLKSCSPIKLKIKVVFSYSNIKGVYCIFFFTRRVHVANNFSLYTGSYVCISAHPNLVLFSKWPIQ